MADRAVMCFVNVWPQPSGEFFTRGKRVCISLKLRLRTDDVNHGGDNDVSSEHREDFAASIHPGSQLADVGNCVEAAIRGSGATGASARSDLASHGRTHLVQDERNLDTVLHPQFVGVVRCIRFADSSTVFARHAADLAHDRAGDVVNVLLLMLSHVTAPFESFLPHNCFDYPWEDNHAGSGLTDNLIIAQIVLFVNTLSAGTASTLSVTRALASLEKLSRPLFDS